MANSGVFNRASKNPLRTVFLLLPILAACLHVCAARAVDIPVVEQMIGRGAYEEAVEAAKTGLGESPGSPEWPLLLAQALKELGRDREAREILQPAVERFPLDLRVRLAAYEILKRTGATEEAQAQLAEMDRLGGSREWAYRTAAERVALGRVALLVDADPKRVLELFFDPVRKAEPEFRDVWIATGELALRKNDFALAAKTFQGATKKFPDEAEAWFGLAQAYAPSDAEATEKAVQQTLSLNARHAGALLLLADHHIDAERYPDADTALAAVLRTNPRLPAAHAYRAVLAHLRSDGKVEREARAEALKSWAKNPEVPHLIGRKLSQKYRFAEGAALQREALKFDPKYMPAKAQLANDLLRLGEDEEGWKLAEEVQKADPYDVVAYNLTTLRDAMADFQTLTSAHFLVRMHPHEAEIYGQKALALLERAHGVLTRKYGMQLNDKTIVEIFPDQKDFAIRTFGLPGGSGYLGVCFGRVITANSPAARPGSTSSWEAVLWHEFTHVITLSMTKNKMPRWLSEGISVYEERQARGSWGEQMKPRYRAMILGKDLTPVSQLSAAFLRPKSTAHLGFAYYESSLVVEWLIERWGLDKMKKLLADLARGVEINAALAAQFAPIEKLDAEFAERATAIAKNTGPKLDWEKPKPQDISTEEKEAASIAATSNNFNVLMQSATTLVEKKFWAAAKAPLKKLIELYPEQQDSDGPYAMLAKVHRELKEPEEELAVLTKLADLASDAVEAFARLMQIHAERKNWDKVLDYSARYQAVNPLRGDPHRQAAEAQEQLGHPAAAIAELQTLLHLNPPNPSEVHYHLARLLHAAGNPTAKRHVLLALEEAPRYRAAHELLLKMVAPAAGERAQADAELPPPTPRAR